MDDPLVVRRFESLGNLPHDRQGVGQRNRSARDALRQILSLHEFHHQRLPPVEFFKTVEGANVRMIQ